MSNRATDPNEEGYRIMFQLVRGVPHRRSIGFQEIDRTVDSKEPRLARTEPPDAAPSVRAAVEARRGHLLRTIRALPPEHALAFCRRRGRKKRRRKRVGRPLAQAHAQVGAVAGAVGEGQRGVLRGQGRIKAKVGTRARVCVWARATQSESSPGRKRPSNARLQLRQQRSGASDSRRPAPACGADLDRQPLNACLRCPRLRHAPDNVPVPLVPRHFIPVGIRPAARRQSSVRGKKSRKEVTDQVRTTLPLELRCADKRCGDCLGPSVQTQSAQRTHAKHQTLRPRTCHSTSR